MGEKTRGSCLGNGVREKRLYIATHTPQISTAFQRPCRRRRARQSSYFPSRRRAPRLGVEVKGSEVERGDLQVGLEVDALGVAEGIAPVAVRREPEPLVAERDHVPRVERFDVRGRLRRPLGDDGRGAAAAARLVG